MTKMQCALKSCRAEKPKSEMRPFRIGGRKPGLRWKCRSHDNNTVTYRSEDASQATA